MAKYMSAISSAVKWLRLGAVGAFAVAFMVGCGVIQTPEPAKAETQAEQTPKPPFEPKQLEARARGISVAKDSPYNCKVLGEAEGKDNAFDKSGTTKELLRESALNDLRNEASYIAGEGKRVMIFITREEVLCEGTVNGTRRSVNCAFSLPKSVKDVVLTSYKIQAQVFDCGDK